MNLYIAIVALSFRFFQFCELRPNFRILQPGMAFFCGQIRPGGPEIGSSLQRGSPCSVAGAHRWRESRRAVAASAALDGRGAEWMALLMGLQWFIDVYSL